MEKIINDVYSEVKRRCMMSSNAYGIGAWDHHIELVYKIAISNYSKYGADRDIVALAALLHDIASVTNKDFTEEHHTLIYINLKLQDITKLVSPRGFEPPLYSLGENCIFQLCYGNKIY